MNSMKIVLALLVVTIAAPSAHAWPWERTAQTRAALKKTNDDAETARRRSITTTATKKPSAFDHRASAADTAKASPWKRSGGAATFQRPITPFQQKLASARAPSSTPYFRGRWAVASHITEQNSLRWMLNSQPQRNASRFLFIGPRANSRSPMFARIYGSAAPTFGHIEN